MAKIISVVGARPQFIKHAPVQLALRQRFRELTIHTGQHYDDAMSRIFFDELGLAKPEYRLDLPATSLQGAQTATMLTEIEKILVDERPDAMVVYGDTNSTLAGVLAAVKLHVPIVHIEAGLRSFNLAMPEEVNRIIADRFSSLLFCPSDAAMENLRQEGIGPEKLRRTGDVMADTLRLVQPLLAPVKLSEPYYFATLHRPSNTDDRSRLVQIFEALQRLDAEVVFPLHPRTATRIESFGLSPEAYPNIRFIDPVGYVDSISLQMKSKAVITDSGGMQKEAYLLRRPCLTLRMETEWVETLEQGWNHLVGHELNQIPNLLATSPGSYKEGLFGDGYAAHAITEEIEKWLQER